MQKTHPVRLYYLEVLVLEDERCFEFASLLGEVDLDEPVPLLPGGLPQGPTGLPYNYEPLLRGKTAG